jgi:hypothetical protein
MRPHASPNVAECTGAHTLFEAGVPRGLGAGVPDGFVGQVLAIAAWFAWEEPRSGFLPPPVLTERFQQLRTHRHVSILAALALAYVDDHAFAIDVFHTQAGQFAAPHPSRVQRHENGARLQIAGRLDQAGYLVRTQHTWRPVM